MLQLSAYFIEEVACCKSDRIGQQRNGVMHRHAMKAWEPVEKDLYSEPKYFLWLGGRQTRHVQRDFHDQATAIGWRPGMRSTRLQAMARMPSLRRSVLFCQSRLNSSRAASRSAKGVSEARTFLSRALASAFWPSSARTWARW